MSAIKKGNAANFVWDLPSGKQFSAIGRNVSINKKRGAEQATLPTDEGETDGLVIYDKNTELAVEAILPTNGALPDVGDVVEIDSTKYVVLDASNSWTRKDWAKISLTVKAWDAMASVIGNTTYPAAQTQPQGSGTGT